VTSNILSPSASGVNTQPGETTSILDHALAYAALGWPVFPCHTPLKSPGWNCTCEKWRREKVSADFDCQRPGKHPHTKNGLDDATTDPDQIRDWWRRWPTANIGINCGKAGLLVVDLDTYRDNYQGDDLELDEETVTALSGGGGTHLFYALEDGDQFGNSNKNLPNGIDIRGHGGYVVVAPSLHKSGQQYHWETDYSPWDMPLAPIPPKLRELLTKKTNKPQNYAAIDTTRKFDHNATRYGAKAIENQCALVATSAEGKRNSTLNTAAFSLGRLVAGGEIDGDYACAELLSAARVVGLTDDEAERTIQSGLEAGKMDPKTATNTAGTKEKDDSASKINKPTRIYQLALEHCQIFSGDDGAVYASSCVDGHTENINVRSMRFRQWLGKLYYDQTGEIAGKSSCDEAIEILAFQTGKAEKTFLRVGGTDTAVYLDLGNEKWDAVEIDSDGWRIVANPPVAFRRTSKMRPLPIPVAPQGEGDVDAAFQELFGLINVAEEDRILVLAWLLAALRHKGPYPILTLIAEAGSAKTTTAKALKRIISPYVAETRSRPKTVDDCYVAAANDWILVYDNLSTIPIDISDALCRLATGGGYATRELYENLEEVVTDRQCPLIINGVADIVKKGDLASRVLTVSLPEITADRRIEESEWERRFAAAHPRILGALFELLSAVLSELPNVKTPLPRMADFAKLGAAIDVVTSKADSPEGFSQRYANSTRVGTLSIIENSPVYRPLWKFMKANGKTWQGSAADLLELLSAKATFEEKLYLPKAGNGLTRELTGIAPNLRSTKLIDIKTERSKVARTITLTQMADFEMGKLEGSYADEKSSSS